MIQINKPDPVDVVLLHTSCFAIDATRLGHTHVITDPPYGNHVHERMTSCANPDADTKGVRHRDAGFEPLSDELQSYIAGACLAAPRWSLVYTDMQGNAPWEYALGGYHKDSAKPRHIRTLPITGDTSGATGYGDTEGGPIGTLPWIRWSMPQMSGDRPPSGCELLVCAHGPGRVRWRGPGNLIALKHACLRGDGKHPTEKPLDQALDLVSWFTDPGDLIYDPTAGYATIGVACVLLGRQYVGCELNPEWAVAGQQRIAAAQEGWLSDRDAHRLMRWRVSIGLTTHDLSIPPQAKTLTKGVVT